MTEYKKEAPKSYIDRGLKEPDIEHYLHEIYNQGWEEDYSSMLSCGNFYMNLARRAWDLVPEEKK